MPVAYDHSGISTYQSSIASGTNFQWSNGATTAGSYAIVSLYQTNPASPMTLAATPTVLTFGGQTMTSLGGVYINNTSADGFIRVFGLPSCPGETPTVSVTLTQAGLVFEGFGASFTYTGVASVGTLQTGYGHSTAGATTSAVPSATGNMVWGTISAAATGGTWSALSLTMRQQYNSATGGYPTWQAGDAPGATVAVSATESASSYWCAAGLNLIAKTPNPIISQAIQRASLW